MVASQDGVFFSQYAVFLLSEASNLKEQGVFVLAHHRVFLPCLQKGMVGGRDAREQLCRLSLPAFNVLACTGTRNTRVFYLSLSLSCGHGLSGGPMGCILCGTFSRRGPHTRFLNMCWPVGRVHVERKSPTWRAQW